MRFVSILGAGLSFLSVACNQTPDPVKETPAPLAVEATGTVKQADSSGSFTGLVPSADDIDNGSLRWAGATGPLWVGYSGQCSTVGSRFRGLNVKFSIPGLPACATITSATLTFHYTGCTSCQAGGNMTVSRIGTAWNESTDGGGCSGPGGSSFGAVGGLVQTAPAVFVSGIAGGVNAAVSFNVTADVQAWVNGSANNGWQLRYLGTPGSPGCPGSAGNWQCPGGFCGADKKHVYTREAGSPNGPTLDVFYTLSDSKCNDGRPCTEDACTSGGCTNTPNNALTCSDGRACTTDSCSGGNCVGTPVNAACDDLNVCTNDVCSPASAGADAAGCVYSNNTNNCTDPAACTQNDKCVNGVCVGTPNNALCDDQNNCTTDTCSASGCQNVITAPGCVTCSTDAQCPSGKYCNGQTCIPTATNGTQCTVASHCASGFCKDGVCCDKACSGQCEACNVSGSVGVCKPVSGPPIAPRAACTTDATVCGGTCNGTVTATCTYPGTTTRCRAPSCTANVGTLAAACNGTGKCPAVQPQPCAPFVCGPTQCVGTCTTNAECQAGRYCAAGMCIPLVEAGKACTADGQCKSGICVDKVCCNSRCSAQCEACDVEGKEGTCSAVPDGVPHGNRPKCVTDGDKGVCNGVCDGTSRDACVYPGPGVQCSDPSCDKGVATVASYCQGTGKCPEPERVDCGNACVGDLCGTDCTTDAVCSINEFCLAGKCVRQHGNGEKCNSPTECASSFCIDGVCCDDACNGQCEACDVEGSAGTCIAAKGNPRGVRPACASIDPECAGTCDGVKGESCTYPGTEKVCTAASCATGVAKLVRTCAGDGACGPIQEQLCAPQVCSGTRCGGGCTVDATCGAGKFCSGGVCVAKYQPGAPCGNDTQCATGFCTDGVCCDQECGEQCQACNDPSSMGRCVAIVGRPHGGRAPCIGTATCAGQCDGKNIRACVLPSRLTECGKAVCTGGVAHEAPVCNGVGTCIAGAGTDCYPFTCSRDEKTCATSCNGDDDCAPGLLCQNGGCVPGPDAGVGPDGGAGTSGGGNGGETNGGASGTAGRPGQGGQGGSSGVAGRGQAGTGGDFTGADGGGIDGGTKPPPKKSEDTGSCGCRIEEKSTGPRDALAALAALALVALRRRGKPRAVRSGSVRPI